MINDKKTIDIIVKYTNAPASHTVTINGSLEDVMSGVYDVACDLDSLFKQKFINNSNYIDEGHIEVIINELGSQGIITTLPDGCDYDQVVKDIMVVIDKRWDEAENK